MCMQQNKFTPVHGLVHEHSVAVTTACQICGVIWDPPSPKLPPCQLHQDIAYDSVGKCMWVVGRDLMKVDTETMEQVRVAVVFKGKAYRRSLQAYGFGRKAAGPLQKIQSW